MAKGEAEPLMTAAEMKPLLMLSKKQPVNCAIGLTRDKMGVILLDKKAKPRKMLAMLKKKASAAKMDLDSASCRYGHAVVDTELDSQLVQFVVNKDVSGAVRPKLLELLKKAGFGKCEIRVESALDSEPDDDEDGAEAEGETKAAAPQSEAGPSTTAPAAGDPAPAPGAAPPVDGAQAPPDAAELTKRLTALVKRMVAALGSNPAGADAMKTAAMAGQAALKSGDLATAMASADTLERMLDATAAAGPQTSGPATAGGPDAPKNGPGSPVFGKARATWVATRKKVESDLEKLHDQLQATYKGHGVVTDLEKTFRSKIEPMMAKFDETLSEKLDEVSKTTDPGAHAKLVDEARQIITKYEQLIDSEPLIAQLDQNPFVPLAIEKTLTASLAALSKAVA